MQFGHCTIGYLDLGGIRGIDSLRGTTMTEYQLAEFSPLFAHYLGVTVT